MKTIIVCISLMHLACFNSTGIDHTEARDVIQQDDRPVTSTINIHPILHSAMALEWDGKTILVDPHGGVEHYKAFPAPDLIFITDIHGDHMDVATLQGLDLSKAQIIAPVAVFEALGQELQEICTVLQNGDQSDAKGVGIEAIPMYNMPDPNDPRHPKGRGNGYLLTLGKERIYISGDTEDIPEMRALTNIDIAFVCMNLPYTMTVEAAAEAVLEFKPRIVYPYHYRGKDGFSDVARFKELVNAEDEEIEVRLEDWYGE